MSAGRRGGAGGGVANGVEARNTRLQGCYEIGRIITPVAKMGVAGQSANSRTATFGERFELLLFFAEACDLIHVLARGRNDNVSR